MPDLICPNPKCSDPATKSVPLRDPRYKRPDEGMPEQHHRHNFVVNLRFCGRLSCRLFVTKDRERKLEHFRAAASAGDFYEDPGKFGARHSREYGNRDKPPVVPVPRRN